MIKFRKNPILLLLMVSIFSCSRDTPKETELYPAITSTFKGKINPSDLPNYADPSIPEYITKDNTSGNSITDEGAVLGRVLFYDKKLSADNSISCSSCHLQKFAFSDTSRQSKGINGITSRHSMRLVNARYGIEKRFFWNERAETLEDQVTQPIQDHMEMGFSGANGAPDMQDLILKLKAVDYYQELFTLAFGDEDITEARLQLALAQFVRSINSFDSKYDAGKATGAIDGNPFPNFTEMENEGKRVFSLPLGVGGAGCAGCHLPPEFDIAPNIGNNGITGIAGDPNGIDVNNTRAPSLRDLINPEGTLNGPLMHDGSFGSLKEVIEHYNFVQIDPRNNNLDEGLRRTDGQPQNLEMTEYEKDALVAFLRTLSGTNLYTDPKYSDPFP